MNTTACAEATREAEWWVIAILCFFGAHALFDCLCTVCTLFPQLRVTGWFATAYPSIVCERYSQQDPMMPRLFMYWVSAMSLVRVIAVCVPCTLTCLSVSVMYVLEGLVAEYEGYTALCVHATVARAISVFSFSMSLLAAAAAVGLQP